MNPTIEAKCNAQVTRFLCHALCGINKSVRMSRVIPGSFDLMHMTSLPREGELRDIRLVKYQEGVGDTFWWSKECQKILLAKLEVKGKEKEIGSWFVSAAARLGETIQS